MHTTRKKNTEKKSWFRLQYPADHRYRFHKQVRQKVAQDAEEVGQQFARPYWGLDLNKILIQGRMETEGSHVRPIRRSVFLLFKRWNLLHVIP